MADLFIPTPTRFLLEVFNYDAIIAQGLITHSSTAAYNKVLIYTAEWTRASWRELKCPIFETAAKGIRTRVVSSENQVFYRWAT